MESGKVSSEIAVSGIPAVVADSPRAIVQRVLGVLDVPELLSAVLETRNLVKRADRVVRDRELIYCKA